MKKTSIATFGFLLLLAYTDNIISKKIFTFDMDRKVINKKSAFLDPETK